MFSDRSRKIVRAYEERQKEAPGGMAAESDGAALEGKDAKAREEELKREIGEAETFFTLMRRMARENKLAVISAAVILLFILAAVFAPLLTPYSFSDMDLMNRLSAPSSVHLFGTDAAGRDILTRLLYGSRVSLLTGVVPTIMSMLAGALLGVIAGYCQGIVDSVIMRIADIVLAFPSMLLAMVIVYMLGVDVRGDDRLRFVAKHLADKSLAYLQCEFRRNVLLVCKTHDEVNCLDRGFPTFRLGGIVAEFGELLIKRLHLRVGKLRLGHAVYGGSQNALIGLVGVEYVGQSLLDVIVDSQLLTVRQSSLTSPFSFSTSAA